MRQKSGGPEEDALIIANFDPHSLGNGVKIAEMLGKSKGYVSTRCKALGLKYIPDKEAAKERAREYNRRYREKIKICNRENINYVKIKRVERVPVLCGWFPGVSSPKSPYQRMLQDCIIPMVLNNG